jgi:hypothetical protein
MDINDAQSYFSARTRELLGICNAGDPWVFVCASTFIEYLAKLVNGRDDGAEGYKKFVTNYLAKVRLEYHTFTYKSGEQDLPVQMYHVLRCGIVHSFSLVPDDRAIRKRGRLRSIVLSHRASGDTHLSPFSSANAPDAAIFVAEDFVEDLQKAVTYLFLQAKADAALTSNIRTWLNDYPPIVGNIGATETNRL